MERVDVLVAGAGIVGSAVAWALAERGVGGIVVADLDLAGLYASSELNAGGARATWWQPVNVATCRATLDFFRAHAETFGFREAGYLWLYDDPALFARARAVQPLQNAHGLGVELLAPGDVAARFPLVDRHLDELAGATFSPRDGLVNPNAVRAWYRAEAERRGVRFLDRAFLADVATAAATPGGRRIAHVDVAEIAADAEARPERLRRLLTTHEPAPGDVVASRRLAPGLVVNCLGAWSPVFCARLGLDDPTTPVRRQVALVDVRARDHPAGVDVAHGGMVVDASGVYFHPEGPHVLAGYSTPDEPPGYDFTYDGDAFFERHLWPRLAHRCGMFERCRHLRGWAGLYAVTPDRSGIAGAVPGVANLVEAHSFTGRGVMQSYGVGVGVAELVTTGRSADLAPLARERFADRARWVVEELHI